MSLKFSLWLIERKLQRSSARPIALELEVMESEWDRLTKVAKDINGGTHEVINQFCYLAQEIIRRFARLIENDMNGPKNYYEMHSRGLAKWFSATTKALQSRLHKLQGLIRFLSNALANSLDVRFTSAQGVLDMLAGAKFLLVDAKGEWKQRGTYLVASSGMAACPAFAAELMASPAIDRSLLDEKYNECYLIVIQVDSAAEGNVVWRGKTLESLPSGIAHIDLEIPAGTMRIISAGSSRLEEHSKKLGEIFGVELFPLFKFGSQANNSSFAKGGSSNGNGGKDGKLGIGPDGRRHSSSH
ncbi:Suppressor of Sensor Kinase (SLN1), partial [Spiromyces aspiralis]